MFNKEEGQIIMHKFLKKIENEQEIRIYKGNGITNSGRIFRIFKENKTWKAELIQ